MQRFYITYLQIVRIVQIIYIIIKYLIKDWFYSTKMGRRKAAKRLKKNKELLKVRTTPERIRLLIEDLGPTFIKFGQIIADRPDVISERFRVELKKLQSTAKPLSNTVAIELIEKELGLPLSDVFETFNKKAIASASIGQCYEAVLKTGEYVVVKIQRPHIEKKINMDLYLLKQFSRWLVKHYPELAAMNIVALVDEFGETIKKELNYYNEAGNIMRFANMFKNADYCYIPKVYMQYTTRRLLVMEKIEGISPDEIEKMKHQGINLTMVAQNGAKSLLKMMMEYGFFHADPHAGNIFIQADARVAWIDFGMVGVLRPREMMFLADFILGFVNKSPSKISKALLDLCQVKFFDQYENFEFDITQIFKSVTHIDDVAHLDIAGLMQECVSVIVKYQLQIPGGIFMLIKSLATIQKFAVNLDPDINIPNMIMPYAKNLVMMKYNPKRIATSVYDTIVNYMDLIQTLPNDLSEILYKLKKGSLKHEVKFQNKDVFKRLYFLGRYLIIACLLIGMFIGSSMLIIWGKSIAFAKLTFFISLFFTLILLLRLMFAKKD